MLTVHRRSVNSSELVKIAVEPPRSQSYVDVTTFPVQLTLVEEGIHPDAGDYVLASWETISCKNYAVALVGPGGLQLPLTDEMYIPWVRVNAGGFWIEAKCIQDVVEVY